jgi:(2S)-methylsuccinyl-CoA dehydrogenase
LRPVGHFREALMTSGSVDELLSGLQRGAAAASRLCDAALAAVRAELAKDGGRDGFDRHQIAIHTAAWMATYARALMQIEDWARSLVAEGGLGELEQLIACVVFGEYLAQMAGGLPMNQGEIVRPADAGVPAIELEAFIAQAGDLIAAWTNSDSRVRITAIVLATGGFGADGLDPTRAMVRHQFARFGDEEIQPVAHIWHLNDCLIPMAIVDRMADMGVFGLTIPEAEGGLGLGKIEMAIVSEELSRSYIGVGSLGTRSEIAAELIGSAGTPAQRARYLPGIASGAILPAAVFTEPDTGSDLGGLRTRAVRYGNEFRITGNKTWITHAARSDLMTLLARTGTPESGWRGLSMFLCEKPRGSEKNPFPADGMAGGEIPVLGYRGMKEYDVSFDSFAVSDTALLGGREGEGFKQLMSTFESARVQTAARAVGVAQNALELGMRYATDRRQFGRRLADFPRIATKLGWMVAETMVARQLTYFAAREKDSGRRCDLEAGMAKLLAARVAWTNADNSLQIHGGNGFALEYPISRVMCDARVLSIFEGTAEIQATVIARRLLENAN